MAGFSVMEETMRAQSHTPAASSACGIASAAGLAVMVIGALVLFGWALGNETIKSVVPGWAVMKPNTALAFVLAGGALCLLRGKGQGTAKRAAASVGAIMVVVIGLLTLAEYLSHFECGIDEWLFRETPAENLWFPGRMAPASALNFVMLGTALLLLDRGRVQWVLALALAAGLTASLALAGYLYGVEFLYGLGGTTEMAFHTALAFLLLAVGVAVACVDEGLMAMLRSNNAAGVLVRRMLPAAFFVPIILGWLRLLGQRAGLFGTEFGTELLVVTVVFIFVVFIWWSTRTVIQLDAGRARAEEELRASEARFRLLVSGVKDYGIFALDRDGRVATWNAGAERISGYLAGEIIGRHFSCFYPPEIIESGLPQRELETAAKEGRFEEEGIRLRKDGSRFWANVVITPLWDSSGSLSGFSKVVRDITERKTAEAMLEHERHLFRSLMDTLPDRIYFKDRESRFLHNNRAHLRRFGLKDPAQAAGKSDFDFFPREHAEHAREVEQMVMASGKLSEREERIEWPDGRVEWALVTKMPLRDPHGEIIGTFGVSRDITAQRNAEDALKRTLAELERSNTELEQFAYVASHDLQEPLRAVTGCVQLLQKSYGGKLDADADELIRHAVEGAARMRTLISDLLAFSRVGTHGKAFEPTDCNAALYGALANLTVALDESRARVTHDPLPTVNADPSQMRQLFQNLVGNGLKFHGERDPEIHVSARPRDGGWLFSVRDNGIGIEPQYRERIFVIFQRLHTRAEYEGTGIGLAICKRIVERHGGDIWVESEPGRGSTFFFTIPGTGTPTP
jgi:PAS domain S-box-containing protein